MSYSLPSGTPTRLLSLSSLFLHKTPKKYFRRNEFSEAENWKGNWFKNKKIYSWHHNFILQKTFHIRIAIINNIFLSIKKKKKYWIRCIFSINIFSLILSFLWEYITFIHRISFRDTYMYTNIIRLHKLKGVLSTYNMFPCTNFYTFILLYISLGLTESNIKSPTYISTLRLSIYLYDIIVQRTKRDILF